MSILPSDDSVLKEMISNDRVLASDVFLDNSSDIVINSGHYSSGTITSGNTIYGTSIAPNYSQMFIGSHPSKRITTRY